MLIVVMFEYKIVDYFSLFPNCPDFHEHLCASLMMTHKPGLRTGRRGQFEEDLVQKDDWKGRG